MKEPESIVYSVNTKVDNALKWIVAILDKHKIEYQIAGGFAAKIYGSSRELNDIDIDVSEKDFPLILPEIAEYITFGPTRFKNAKWDCERIELNYHGQAIDITGADSIRMSNKERTRWISYENTGFNSVDCMVNGLTIKVMDAKDLLEYKKELDGEHQKVDIEALEQYLSV